MEPDVKHKKDIKQPTSSIIKSEIVSQHSIEPFVEQQQVIENLEESLKTERFYSPLPTNSPIQSESPEQEPQIEQENLEIQENTEDGEIEEYRSPNREAAPFDFDNLRNNQLKIVSKLLFCICSKKIYQQALNIFFNIN